MPRYFVQLSYDGNKYRGWQFQPNAVSVQETIQKGMSMLLRQEVSVVGCGRTDAGVHAKDFWLHFEVEDLGMEERVFLFKMNNIVPFDIAFHAMVDVDILHEEMRAEAEKYDERPPRRPHARFGATSREYKYFIHFNKNPFYQNLSMKSFYPLDMELMNQAADILMKYDNFASFERTGADNSTSICQLTHAKWERDGNQLIFTIAANRFLRNMVRAIVGTMMDVGRKRITVEEFEAVIISKSRKNAGTSAPANGLFLTRVEYPFL